MEQNRLTAILKDSQTTTEELINIILECDLTNPQIFLVIHHENSNSDVIEALYCEYPFDAEVVMRIIGSYNKIKAGEDVIVDIIDSLSNNANSWPRASWEFIHSAIIAIIKSEQLTEYDYVKNFTYDESEHKRTMEDESFYDDCPNGDNFYDNDDEHDYIEFSYDFEEEVDDEADASIAEA